MAKRKRRIPRGWEDAAAVAGLAALMILQAQAAVDRGRVELSAVMRERMAAFRSAAQAAKDAVAAVRSGEAVLADADAAMARCRATVDALTSEFSTASPEEIQAVLNEMAACLGRLDAEYAAGF